MSLGWKKLEEPTDWRGISKSVSQAIADQLNIPPSPPPSERELRIIWATCERCGGDDDVDMSAINRFPYIAKNIIVLCRICHRDLL